MAKCQVTQIAKGLWTCTGGDVASVTQDQAFDIGSLTCTTNSIEPNDTFTITVTKNGGQPTNVTTVTLDINIGILYAKLKLKFF